MLFPLIAYIYVYMPETVPPSLRKPFAWAHVGEAFRSQVPRSWLTRGLNR